MKKLLNPKNYEALKEGVDFKFLTQETKEENATALIEVLVGKFAGAVYQYGTVSVNESPTGEGVLNFVYNVFSVPEGMDAKTLEKDGEFHQLLGDILLCIVTMGIETMEKEKGLIDETGSDDIIESDI